MPAAHAGDLLGSLTAHQGDQHRDERHSDHATDEPLYEVESQLPPDLDSETGPQSKLAEKRDHKKDDTHGEAHDRPCDSHENHRPQSSTENEQTLSGRLQHRRSLGAPDLPGPD